MKSRALELSCDRQATVQYEDSIVLEQLKHQLQTRVLTLALEAAGKL